MSQRVYGYDLARALALFGMVVVNFKLVMGSSTGSAWLKHVAGMLEGRAVAVFVVLAGIGITLLSQHSVSTGNLDDIKSTKLNLVKRAVLLVIVGFAYTPIWPADILHFYGFYILIGACLLGASDTVLWIAIAVLSVVFVVLLFILDYETGWDFDSLTYLDFWTLNGMVRHLFFNGFHPVFPWAALLILGMWLGRRDLTDLQVQKRLIAVCLPLWAAVELLSKAMTRLDLTAHGISMEDSLALFGTAPMPPMPWYIIAGGSFAVVIVTLCVRIASRSSSFILTALYHTGQLSLTFYVGHVFLGMGVLQGLGMLENQSIETALFAALLYCGFCVLFASLWRSKFSVGPLEWLFRRVARI